MKEQRKKIGKRGREEGRKMGRREKEMAGK